jgi:cysteinyl-tRNA synthetase
VVLDLEASLHGWAADTLQSDELDRGRAALRSMVVRLAAVAEVGAADPRERLGPFVEALLGLRRQAREDKRYADADAVRDRLVELGVEVRDTPAGTEWELT